jgi:hypothetical protein
VQGLGQVRLRLVEPMFGTFLICGGLWLALARRA